MKVELKIEVTVQKVAVALFAAAVTLGALAVWIILL